MNKNNSEQEASNNSSANNKVNHEVAYSKFEEMPPVQRIQIFIWEILNIVKNLNILKQWISYSLGIKTNNQNPRSLSNNSPNNSLEFKPNNQ